MEDVNLLRRDVREELAALPYTNFVLSITADLLYGELFHMVSL